MVSPNKILVKQMAIPNVELHVKKFLAKLKFLFFKLILIHPDAFCCLVISVAV